MEDDSLSFSVTIFTICAFLTISGLMLRRVTAFFGNAELGGPTTAKYLTGAVFVGFWMIYVLMASLNAYGHIPGF